MPIFNALKLYGDEVTTQVLQPGETLIDMGPTHEPLNPDTSKLELEDHALSKFHREFLAEHGRRLETSDSWFQGIDCSGIHINSDRINRAMSGLRGIGAPNSIAGQMWRATRFRSGSVAGSLHWAATDRRLLMIRGDIAVDRTWTVMYSVPRSSIARAARRGKLLFQWGRVELSFTDGSMLAYTPGLLDVVAAPRPRRRCAPARAAPRARLPRPRPCPVQRVVHRLGQERRELFGVDRAEPPGQSQPGQPAAPVGNRLDHAVHRGRLVRRGPGVLRRPAQALAGGREVVGHRPQPFAQPAESPSTTASSPSTRDRRV
jgi:hypothetical protein